MFGSAARRAFHATPRKEFVGKLAALSAGFFLRLFYKELAPAHRQMMWSWPYWRNMILNSPKLVTFTLGSTVLFGGYALACLDKTPISGRSRFIWTNRQEMLDYSQDVLAAVQYNESRKYLHISTEKYR